VAVCGDEVVEDKSHGGNPHRGYASLVERPVSI
jgi:hypothetical protein